MIKNTVSEAHFSKQWHLPSKKQNQNKTRPSSEIWGIFSHSFLWHVLETSTWLHIMKFITHFKTYICNKNKLFHIKESIVLWLHICFTTQIIYLFNKDSVYNTLLFLSPVFTEAQSFSSKNHKWHIWKQTSKKGINYELKFQINIPNTSCYSRAHFGII